MSKKIFTLIILLIYNLNLTHAAWDDKVSNGTVLSSQKWNDTILQIKTTQSNINNINNNINTLNNNINTLSGIVNGVQNEINNNVVKTTGNQTIGGYKTFKDRIYSTTPDGFQIHYDTDYAKFGLRHIGSDNNPIEIANEDINDDGIILKSGGQDVASFKASGIDFKPSNISINRSWDGKPSISINSEDELRIHSESTNTSVWVDGLLRADQRLTSSFLNWTLWNSGVGVQHDDRYGRGESFYKQSTQGDSYKFFSSSKDTSAPVMKILPGDAGLQVSNQWELDNSRKSMIQLKTEWNGVPFISFNSKRQADWNFDEFRMYYNYDTSGMNSRSLTFWGYTTTPGNGGGCGWGGCVPNILILKSGFNDTPNPTPHVIVGGDLYVNPNNSSPGNIYANGKLVIQNNQNGGSSRGIYMWNANDTNWGIYMGESGDGRSLAGRHATSGDGFSSNAIRFRVSKWNGNGFIFENSAEQNLFSIRGDDGYAAMKGTLKVNYANIYGGGLILSDDGDIVDLNDGYASMRFSLGVKVYSNNRGGSPVITLGSNGVVTASDFVYSSDKRLKNNITKLNNNTILDKVNKLNGYSYTWKKDENKKDEKGNIITPKKSIGVIAQEVEKVFPELVEKKSDGYLGVHYGNFVGVFIESIKELYKKVTNNSNKINNLEKEINNLKEENKLLKEKLNKIEERLNKLENK